MKGYCARLALILQEARVAAGEADSEAVDAVSVEGAVRLIDYFKSHARKVYARLSSPELDEQIATAVDWIRRKGGEASARDLYTGKVAGFKTSRDAEKLIGQLETHGWGHIESRTPPTGGRVSRVFVLHSADGEF